MQSIKELFKYGRGPSSSHTLAPERACRLFMQVNGSFPQYEAELFGSLSLTGKGHFTDHVIMETLDAPCRVIFSREWEESFPNGFYLKAFDEEGKESVRWTVFSIGGGSIEIKEYPVTYNEEVYKENSYREILCVLEEKGISLLDYIYTYEPDLPEYLNTILDGMINCVARGLKEEGFLPGRLHMERSAGKLYKDAEKCSTPARERLLMMAYAYAANEENASGRHCVTAPTLGACGVFSSVIYYYFHDRHISRQRLCEAMAIGGIFGNLIKHNGTISGAVGGCQAEVGAAVSMASAAISFLEGQSLSQIEYAAEIGMEHHLGLTCDPVMGYVMIPCIERNAMGVVRAFDAALLANYMGHIRKHMVSFDTVVKTMKETGRRIPIELKETSEAGLAREFQYADES